MRVSLLRTVALNSNVSKVYILVFGAFLPAFLLKKVVRSDLRTGLPPSSAMMSSMFTSTGDASKTSLKLFGTFPSIR